MADTVNIIELDIDQEQLLKDITKLQQEITDLKDDTKKLSVANKDLEKDGKKNTDQYKANSKQIEINKVQTKGLSTEYRNNQSTLVALNQSETKQLGTLQQLEIQNKQLRTEAKSLDLTRESGRKRLTQVNKELDKNNKFIKNNADETKKQKLNIGNYQGALQGLPGPLAGASRGVGILTTAFKALIANPIGLILAAIALAIKLIADAISKNQASLDRFKAIGDGIAAAYDAVLDRINSVIAAMRRLGKFNFKTIADGFRGITTEIVEEFKAAKQLREELQRLEDVEIGDITRKAELRQAIERARLASKETNITEQERLKLVDQAIALEEELLKIEIEAATERARISQEQIDLGESTRAEIEANAILQAKVIDVETASLKRRRTLASERKTIALKAAKEAEDIAAREALVAAMAVDQAIELETIKSIAINEVRDKDVDLQKARLETLQTLNETAAENELTLADLVAEQKLDLAQDFTKNIATIFGKNTAIGKAAAIAETAINTYRGAQAAYAALAGVPIIGPGLGAVAAGAAIAAGLANVKKILAINSGLPGDSGGGGIGGISSSPARSPFRLNKVSSFGAASDGGLSTQSIINSTTESVTAAFAQALADAPPVLVIEDVTLKQSVRDSISRVTTV